MKDDAKYLRNHSIQERRQAAVARGTPAFANFYASHARNAEIWDTEGNRYIDFAGGIGVLNTGHSHPRIVAAVQKQVEAFSHTCSAVVPYESYVRLAERLNDIAPIDAPCKSTFFTTGAEAVENAVKAARAFTGRGAVISFCGGFHGRTMLGMGLTGKMAPYKIGLGPFPGDIFHVPFPSHGVSVAQALGAVRQLFVTSVEAIRVAAIIVEPVQGEGGFNPAPTDFLQGLRTICDAHGIILIADEIQSGMGRTGRWFAIENSGVKPDLIVTAKSLAAGYPLSGLIGRAEVMDAPVPGSMGGTYAGNATAIAAATTVLEVIEDEKLLDRSMQLGKVLMARMTKLQATISGIADVRGLGSMIAVELCVPGKGPFEFDSDRAKKVQAMALTRGLILLLCGPGGSAIRFLYPLTIQDEVFAEGIDILESCLRETA